ncbi:hypothetical protein D3C71_1240870 [compost metagenome]
MVGGERFVGAIAGRRYVGQAARACLAAQPEQVGRGAFEVVARAVDVQVLQQPLAIPALELVGAQVRDRAPHRRQGRIGIQAEVQPDPTHAFALERQVITTARGGRAGVCGDTLFGAGKLAGIDEVHDAGKFGGVGGIVATCRHCLGRQQQCREQTGDDRQTRFANDTIHSDTSPARVVMAV